MALQPAAQSAPKRAVLYLRVSTPRQMHTAVDIDPEGNSIATQREACLAKAQSLDAVIVAEYVEPGNSAQSIEKRPVFRELLAYLEAHRDVDYVIVYMRSRAFRNSVDAAITKRALSLFGIRIISCKEDFGTGPVADAMETVADAFNELQVRQNGEDIRQKLRHKALNGGTISRAKIGYLNVRADQDGRLFNTIATDERRAPLVRHAFELYASGDYSIDLLQLTMTDLGLTTRPSGRWPQEKPISTSKLHAMLSDPYYAGWVSVDGQLVVGRHQAIVDQALWDRVQLVLEARSKLGKRDRLLQHYLKGLLFCQRCDAMGRTSRLIYTEARGRTGVYYGYFLCRSRQEGLCDLPHLPAAGVEDAVGRHFRTLYLAPDFLCAVRLEVSRAMRDGLRLTLELNDRLRGQLAKLDAREERLIDLAADGALSPAKIQQRVNAIRMERQRVQASLADTSAELALGAERLEECLCLIADVARLYSDAPDPVRRQLNQAIFHKLLVDDGGQSSWVVRDVLRSPFDEIRDAAQTFEQPRTAVEAMRTVTPPSPGPSDAAPRVRVLADLHKVKVSSKDLVVELRGLEPLTPTLPECSWTVRTEPSACASHAKLGISQVERTLTDHLERPRMAALATDLATKL